MPRQLFYWYHTTARQSFETGVQRVTRQLGRALQRLGIVVVPVGRDERNCLFEAIGHGVATFDRLLAESQGPPVLFVPEITTDLIAMGIEPLRLGRAYGMRTLAFVHDLIPLKLWSHYESAFVERFEAYYASFAGADRVLATTQAVARELRQFLEGRGLHVPPIDVLALPAQFVDYPRVLEAKPPRAAGEPLNLVTVASREPRKNLLRLLRSLGRAQREVGVPITLTLAGRQGFFPNHDAAVDAALAEASGVTAPGFIPDAALAARIAACHATVYPSWEEGFGLPIGESLWLGTPCVCHNALPALADATGGGTLAIDMTDDEVMTKALITLATEPSLLTRLGDEARARPLLSWAAYAASVAAVLDGL